MNMLKGLESINWSALKHEGQEGSVVLKFLNDVVSGNSRVRIDALVFLLGKGDYGPKFGYDFFSTTPYIVTALLNILSDAEIAEVVKSSILEDLYYVFKVSADAFQIGPNKAFRFPSSIEVNFERLNVAYEVYQILLNGENIYKQLLADVSSRIRSDATSMLEILPIHSSEVIELLKQRIHIEPELHVRVGIAYALSRKFKNIDYWLGCFTNEADIDFKRTLALIYIELLMGLRAEQNKQINKRSAETSITVPNEVISFLETTLIRGLIDETGVPFHMDSQRGKLLLALMKADCAALFRILKTPEINPEVTHILTREMLDFLLVRQDFSVDWILYETNLANKKIYRGGRLPIRSRNKSLQGICFSSDYTKTLQMIVECDKFWEIETNLLSFFWGLPDSRDELRKLIAES